MENKDLKIHRGITEELHATFVAKNKDYGNSFEQSLDEFGSIAGVVRIGDKFNRLKSLTKSDKAEVLDESIEDTLLDMANYAIMQVAWLRKKQEDNIPFDSSLYLSTIDIGDLSAFGDVQQGGAK